MTKRTFPPNPELRAELKLRQPSETYQFAVSDGVFTRRPNAAQHRTASVLPERSGS